MTWLLGLVCGLVVTLTVSARAADAQELAAVAQAQAGSADNRFVFVEIRDGLLTVKVHAVPLAEVLQEVARHANLKVFSHGEITEPITVEFENLALDEGVQRLIGNQDYVFIYSQEDGEPALARLVEVWLYPAIAASQPRGGDAAKGTGAPQALEQWVQTAQFGTDRRVRTQAIRRLGGIGGEEAAAALAALLLQDPDTSIRRQAARALGRIGKPVAISALDSGLTDPEPQVRREVIKALRRIKDEAAAAPLTQALLTDQDPRIRREAARALSRRGEEVSRDVLRSGLEDPDPSVRKAVERALHRWEKSHRRGRR